MFGLAQKGWTRQDGIKNKEDNSLKFFVCTQTPNPTKRKSQYLQKNTWSQTQRTVIVALIMAQTIQIESVLTTLFNFFFVLGC